MASLGHNELTWIVSQLLSLPYLWWAVRKVAIEPLLPDKLRNEVREGSIRPWRRTRFTQGCSNWFWWWWARWWRWFWTWHQLDNLRSLRFGFALWQRISRRCGGRGRCWFRTVRRATGWLWASNRNLPKQIMNIKAQSLWPCGTPQWAEWTKFINSENGLLLVWCHAGIWINIVLLSLELSLKFQWNVNRNENIFSTEDAFEKVGWKMSVI